MKKRPSQIVLSQYSPLMSVDTPLTDAQGAAVEVPRVYSLCRCGESGAKPMCDGTHAKVGFVGTREDSAKGPLEYYEGKDITIVYDRYMCMGAGFCGELEAVFGTHDAPIYEPDGAPVEEIIATIRKCPSGALTYMIDGVHYKDFFDKPEIVIERNGPVHTQGGVDLIDDQLSDELLPLADHYVLCRCGGSKKKPLCDGSHEENGFEG
ncbi:MAG: CDGSH iron-sulfur domain-containing protein [Pseudodesulfovibrio sp.]|uniref:CDGSH iron-sulfur domain-containing protein n=1 Tax=Pseudodesulfovibrio sp. TaxID=2035812 RepID=UPI003D0A9730